MILDPSVSSGDSAPEAAQLDPGVLAGNDVEQRERPSHALSGCEALFWDAQDSRDSGVFEVKSSTGGGFQAFCDMENVGGGWTLVLKADGRSTVFSYDNFIWTNEALLSETSHNLEREESKLRGYLELNFSEIRIDMVAGNNAARPLVLAVDEGRSATLLELMKRDGGVATSAGRSAWLATLASADLQPHCAREGINPSNDTAARVRIGVVGDNEANCAAEASHDSWFGVGGRRLDYSTQDTTCSSTVPVDVTTGNGVQCGRPWLEDRSIAAFAYVFVR